MRQDTACDGNFDTLATGGCRQQSIPGALLLEKLLNQKTVYSKFKQLDGRKLEVFNNEEFGSSRRKKNNISVVFYNLDAQKLQLCLES